MFRYFSLALLFSAFITPASGKESSLKTSLGIGYFYSEGEHQEGQHLNLASIPVTLKFQQNLTTFKISSNYFRYYRAGDSNNKPKKLEGPGSIYISAKQLFKTAHIVDYLDLEGKIKTPSNHSYAELDSSGFDFILSTSVYYRLAKNWFTAKLAYRWRGDTDLNNTLSTSIGVSRKLSNKIGAGLIIEHEEALQESSDNALESTIYLSWKASQKLKYSWYFIKGFKDKKLDTASGLQATVRW